MHGQAREPRQGRKAATVTMSSQCRGVPGHFSIFARWSEVGACLPAIRRLRSVFPRPPAGSCSPNVHRLPSHRPQVASAGFCRRRRAGPCGAHAAKCDRAQPDRPRLPLRRPARHREDLDGADFCQGAQLHGRAERRFRSQRSGGAGHRGRLAPRRDRDRRRVQQRRGQCSRPARNRAICSGAGQI